MLDSSNASGMIEFSFTGAGEDVGVLYPVKVAFSAKSHSLCGVQVDKLTDAVTNAVVKCQPDVTLQTEQYEVV